MSECRTRAVSRDIFASVYTTRCIGLDKAGFDWAREFEILSHYHIPRKLAAQSNFTADDLWPAAPQPAVSRSIGRILNRTPWAVKFARVGSQLHPIALTHSPRRCISSQRLAIFEQMRAIMTSLLTRNATPRRMYTGIHTVQRESAPRAESRHSPAHCPPFDVEGGDAGYFIKGTL